MCHVGSVPFLGRFRVILPVQKIPKLAGDVTRLRVLAAADSLLQVVARRRVAPVLWPARHLAAKEGCEAAGAASKRCRKDSSGDQRIACKKVKPK